VKFLLDTHVFLWVLAEPDRLAAETRRLLVGETNEVFVSIISFSEIVVKRRVGKLAADFDAPTAQLSPASKLQLLDLTPHHLSILDRLPFHERHRDPFDHLIIAQAISETMTLLTRDEHARLYPVQSLTP